jgi:hypothetical protein
LELFGFGPCYHMHELFGKPVQVKFWEDAIEGKSYALKPLLKDYKSMVDFPACSYYRELYEMFPGSKVVLAYRDPEEWYESISNTIFQIDWDLWNLEHPNNDFLCRVGIHNKKLINIRTFHNLLSDQQFCIEIYKKHIEDVKKSIPSKDILIFKLEDGWIPLCEFIGISQPDIPFPFENKRKLFSKLVESNKM